VLIDRFEYCLCSHHEHCGDERIEVVPWDRVDTSCCVRTIKFLKSCNMPDLELAPGVKNQKWWVFGDVGTVVRSSTEMKDVPFAHLFTVEDCLVVKSTGPARVSITATMEVAYLESSPKEGEIFDNVSKEVVAWYVAYIAAMRDHLKSRPRSSLSSPLRSSFQHRFSLGHDDVEDSDDEHDHDHDFGGAPRSSAEIELSQL
jgi:hypothetical protein